VGLVKSGFGSSYFSMSMDTRPFHSSYCRSLPNYGVEATKALIKRAEPRVGLCRAYDLSRLCTFLASNEIEAILFPDCSTGWPDTSALLCTFMCRRYRDINYRKLRNR